MKHHISFAHPSNNSSTSVLCPHRLSNCKLGTRQAQSLLLWLLLCACACCVNSVSTCSRIELLVIEMADWKDYAAAKRQVQPSSNADSDSSSNGMGSGNAPQDGTIVAGPVGTTSTTTGNQARAAAGGLPADWTPKRTILDLIPNPRYPAPSSVLTHYLESVCTGSDHLHVQAGRGHDSKSTWECGIGRNLTELEAFNWALNNYPVTWTIGGCQREVARTPVATGPFLCENFNLEDGKYIHGFHMNVNGWIHKKGRWHEAWDVFDASACEVSLITNDRPLMVDDEFLITLTISGANKLGPLQWTLLLLLLALATM
eukprot:TRINITY_DN14127_c0_g1_i1.p1 TRINITY_DN14127_c0_g1~~TRINITY_DN14127_c0_g1_i1.p1  ORF type:complete len:315 (+),score=16.03 TRINITY_DN14127_c0_g1_i1:50-994(+)